LSTSCCRSLELPAAKQTSSAKRRLMPEVLAPTSLSSSANAITTLSRMLNSNDDNVHRCHFWDHHLITFGTFLDHFGTRNFKHVITLRDVYEAGQSIARLLLCRIGMFWCLLDQQPQWETRPACSLNAALMRYSNLRYDVWVWRVTLKFERCFTGAIVSWLQYEVCSLREYEAIVRKMC